MNCAGTNCAGTNMASTEGGCEDVTLDPTVSAAHMDDDFTGGSSSMLVGTACCITMRAPIADCYAKLRSDAVCMLVTPNASQIHV